MSICEIVENEKICGGKFLARGMCRKHYERWYKTGDALTPNKKQSRRASDGTFLKCAVEGCESDVSRRLMCIKHAGRVDTGIPVNAILQRDKTPEERFWEKVDKNGGIPENPWRWDESMGECWRWTAAKRNLSGKDAGLYGAFRLNGKQMLAPRVAYLFLIGDIPESLTLDHLCRNPICVNPAHLEAVTMRENQNRRDEMKTHCRNGHEYTPENTYLSPHGVRACRICRSDSAKRSREKKLSAET